MGPLLLVGLIVFLVYEAMTTNTNTSSGSSSGISLLDRFAAAIIPTEGGPGNVNYRNNNPGNLVFLGQKGAIGKDAAGFAIFPDFQTGLDALKAQIFLDASRNPNWSLNDFFKKYLGGNGPGSSVDDAGNVTVNGKFQGNFLSKALAVANAIGVSASTTLGQIVKGG